MLPLANIKKRPVTWLQGNVDRANISEDFDEATLNAIGADVIKWHEIDDASRSEWKEQVEKGMAVAKQVMEVKNTPWQSCANFKDPLIAEAAMNFASRAMGEVVRGKDVIKNEVVGDDPVGLKEARAKRVSTCMSYQVLTQQPEWYPGTDQLLTSLPIIGMYYKCTYRDTALGRNVSEARSPLEVVVHNDTKTLALADRIGWEFKRNRNYILEKIRNGVWNDIEDKLSPDEDCPLQMFVEQQCWYDLDDDGYKEPYLITVHRESGAVARICVCYEEDGIVYGKSADGGQKVLRIMPMEYYTEFSFLLQPDGTFHKMGFAQLLGAITELINTGFNQLYDAGTIAIRRPGFIGKTAKIPSGGIKAQLGMLTPVDASGQDLRQSIVFPDFAGPSATMFQVVELLLDRGHKLASISDSMQGETGGANVPATTTLALLDQALKTFTSILWRQYYSFASEYKKLRNLNYLYLTDKEYINIIDISVEDLKKLGLTEHIQVGPGGMEIVSPAENSVRLVQHDFNPEDCDIEPVMDPKASSEALRLARLNAMVQAAGMPPNVGRIYLKGIGCSQADIEAIFPSPEIDPQTGKPIPPPPDPKMVEVQAKIQQMQQQGEQKDRELELKHAELEQKESMAIWTIEKLKTEIVNLKANSIKALADAEAKEIGTQVSIYKAEMDQLNAEAEREVQALAQQQEAQGGKDDDNGSGTGTNGDTGTDKSGTSAVAQPQGDAADNGISSGAAASGIGDAFEGAGSDGIESGGSVLGESVGTSGGDGLHPSTSQLAAPGPMQ